MQIDQNRLLIAVARACLTDKELCERAGIARPTLTKIKGGRRAPKPATVGKLAKALAVPVEELIAWEVLQ